jgi:hypothetical protein
LRRYWPALPREFWQALCAGLLSRLAGAPGIGTVLASRAAGPLLQGVLPPVAGVLPGRWCRSCCAGTLGSPASAPWSFTPGVWCCRPCAATGALCRNRGPMPRPGPSARSPGGDPPGVRDFGLPGGLRQDGRTAGGHAPGPGRCLHAPEKNTKKVRLSGSKNLSPEQRKRKKMEDSFPQSFQLCRIGKIWDENCVGFVF